MQVHLHTMRESVQTMQGKVTVAEEVWLKLQEALAAGRKQNHESSFGFVAGNECFYGNICTLIIFQIAAACPPGFSSQAEDKQQLYISGWHKHNKIT